MCTANVRAENGATTMSLLNDWEVEISLLFPKIPQTNTAYQSYHLSYSLLVSFVLL